MSAGLEAGLTYGEVVGLPASWTGCPPAADLDLNGHLNHLAYLQLGTASCRPLMHGYLGFGPEYVHTRQLTTFVVDQHIGYRAEIRDGEPMSAHTVVHRLSERSLTVRSYLLNLRSEQIAAVMDMTVVHVAVATRRAVPFPDDVRPRIVTAQHHLTAALGTLPRPLGWYFERDASGRPD